MDGEKGKRQATVRLERDESGKLKKMCRVLDIHGRVQTLKFPKHLVHCVLSESNRKKSLQPYCLDCRTHAVQIREKEVKSLKFNGCWHLGK